MMLHELLVSLSKEDSESGSGKTKVPSLLERITDPLRSWLDPAMDPTNATEENTYVPPIKSGTRGRPYRDYTIKA